MHALHGWALTAGTLAVGLPVLIHWLTRARGTRFVLPTVRFILETLAARRRLSQLRDLVVLALRTAAVAALAAAFARLALQAPEPPPGAESPGRWAVVVLDVSQSMAASLQDKPKQASPGQASTPFVAAQLAAQAVLRDVSRADVILAGQHPRAVFGRLSGNLAAHREEVGKAAVRPEMFDPTAAVAEAAAIVRALSPEERKDGAVVILSDLQRSSWSTASFADLPADVAIRVVDAREGCLAVGNAAVLRAWASGLVTAGRPATVTAELAFDGDAPVTRELQFEFDGRVVRRLVTLQPRQRRQESFVVTPEGGGGRVGRFRLAGGTDAMAVDDVRAVALPVREERRIVVVTAEPAHRVGGAAYFFDRALKASEAAAAEIAAVRPDRLGPDLETAGDRPDLVVLASPGRLSRPAMEAFGRLLARGLPVLYVLQTPVDADNLAELEAILGPAARLPVRFVPLERGAPPRFLVWADLQRRPFKVFGAGLDRLTRDLLLVGGLRSVPRGGDEEGRVLARLSDTSAALVVIPVQSGRLALLNLPLTGAQHLGKSALCVPLLQELVLDLLGGPERGGARAAVCGRAFSLPLPVGDGRVAGDRPWRVMDETGNGVPGPRVVEDRGGPLLVWSPADRPGGYRVLRGEIVEEVFAVGLPPEESDLGAIDPRIVEERLAGGRAVRVAGASAVAGRPPREREIWPIFAGIALLCLALELVALKLFRT